MPHKLRNPQRFLFLEKGADTSVSQETAVPANPPASPRAWNGADTAQSGTQLPRLGLRNIPCVGPQTTGIKEQKSHWTRHRGKIPLFLCTKSGKQKGGNWQSQATVFSLWSYTPWQLEVLSQELHQQHVASKIPACVQNAPSLLLL